MSRPYRLRVTETVRRHVVVEDGVTCGLDLLDLLPCEEQDAILAAELSRRGFSVKGGVGRRALEGGVTVEIDITERRVHVSHRREQTIEQTKTSEIRSYKQEVSEEDRAQARAAASQALEAETEQERQKVTAELEASLADLRLELDDIAVKVTQEALRRKAARMGEIESITEDRESGSMTIRIRV